jgi:peroxiredoxin
MPEVTPNTIYKNPAGQVISKEKFQELQKQSNGKLMPKPVMEGEKVKEMTLIEMTEEQRTQMKGMMEKLAKYSKEWVGKKAPDFMAKDLDDNKISLSKLKGKVVVLKFWFTACSPCKEEMPALNKMIEKKYNNNKEVVFLAPCLDDKETTKKILATNPFSFTSLYNAKDISKNYGVLVYPTHVVIDKNGIITYATAAMGIKSLEDAIDKALSGKGH